MQGVTCVGHRVRRGVCRAVGEHPLAPGLRLGSSAGLWLSLPNSLAHLRRCPPLVVRSSLHGASVERHDHIVEANVELAALYRSLELQSQR